MNAWKNLIVEAMISLDYPCLKTFPVTCILGVISHTQLYVQVKVRIISREL